MIKLEDKLYTSTEVAQILGVSLRSVYRYIEEDKLIAEVKTATGRHRFTKQNIIDFLYPEGQPEEKDVSTSPVSKEEKVAKKEDIKPVAEEVVEEKIEAEKEVKKEEVAPAKKEEKEPEAEESVDWLAKFREAAKKFESEAGLAEETEEKESLTGLAGMVEAEPEAEEESISMVYYRSRLGGLKDIAQNIDKNAKSSSVPYAFTLHAGLSLFSPIKPFSMLHTYVRSQDKEFFERILMLTPADEANSQLCLLVSDEAELYDNASELHGLKVVAKERLLSDIKELDQELLKEAEKVLK